MAIIDKQIYKLDVYSNNERIWNEIYNWFKKENGSNKMLKNLVFYDCTEVLDMHSKEMRRQDVYDISKLKILMSKQTLENKGLDFDKVVLLDRYCLGVYFKDLKTNETCKDKLLYINSEGEGYLTDDIEPANNGYVPDYVYFESFKRGYYSLNLLDEKYYDGTHDEFLKQGNDIFRERIENSLVSIFGERHTLEEVSDLIRKNVPGDKSNLELTEKCRSAELIMSIWGAWRIIEFDKKYYEKYPEKMQKKEKKTEKMQ